MNIYRDGVEHRLDKGTKVKTRKTRAGHIIESWMTNGKRVYFANLADSVYCAHGDTEEGAISAAIWKDPARRPSMEALLAEIRPVVKTRKITVYEFRALTGACLTGCKHFLEQRGLGMDTAMTLDEFLPIGGEWAQSLKRVIEGAE